MVRFPKFDSLICGLADSGIMRHHTKMQYPYPVSPHIFPEHSPERRFLILFLYKVKFKATVLIINLIICISKYLST